MSNEEYTLEDAATDGFDAYFADKPMVAPEWMTKKHQQHWIDGWKHALASDTNDAT